MNDREQYIEPDNSYYKPSRDPGEGTVALVVIMTVLFVVLTTVLAVVYFKKHKDGKAPDEAKVSQPSAVISVASPTPTPVPPLTEDQNAVLYPGTATINMETDEGIDPKAKPEARHLTESVFAGEDRSLQTDYKRAAPIYFDDPINYGMYAGIYTFRGNNFRNCASFGYTTISDGTIKQVWEFKDIGKLLASTLNFEWSGVRWTGQPIVIKWPQAIKNTMNLYDNAKAKQDLVEVIIAACDGKIYFLDMDTGEQTRDPIKVGVSIKGTPALDPRGYPILYVGQCDNNGGSAIFGMYIYSLIDGKQLYHYDGGDDSAYRANWRAFDSSPIIDAESDTLIWPCENGIIYTFELHTNYAPGINDITLEPERVGYKYIFDDNSGSHMGVESSISVYGNYGYYVDNTSNLVCLDLNTMKMVWCVVLGDDSDVTPAISEENGIPYVYVGTEVDNQSGTGQYCGAAYVYKVNGLTGEVIWQTSEPCYTYNGETSETDQNGGCFGNPIIGKNSISNLVIVPFSMTKGLMSGNKLVAYDKDRGTKVWEYDMNIYSYSSPVDCYDKSGQAYIVIGDSIGQIHLVSADSSACKRLTYLQCSRNIGTKNATTSGLNFEASPVVYGNRMIIGTTGGSVFGIDLG
ncbi:MAG: PQQ-binding-like beta-propeller repeat protein [Clostridiales bacterium]|nr:PQQ-binding-like beta-propeller repeat protein [Clostridiales bacterium]